jgi:hypothetical protein
VDDGGPFNALGTSLFWALWGEAHDADRLDANLSWLAARGVDYVRVLGTVGGESWSDRVIDGRAPDYWATVDRFFARLARHGLRAQVTIFAGAQEMMPDPAERRRFADAWAARAETHRERIVMLEVANEAYQNGIEDVNELRALGARLAERTVTPVALSAFAAGQACATNAGSSADLTSVHYDRDTRGDPWRAVWQPWNWPAAFDAACRGRLPPAINNEPIGPQSSVSEDDDPERLVMAYVMTFLGQNAAYVLHTGAGIRGGGHGDRVRKRSANLWEVPRLDVALAGIQRTRSYLPAGLANWSRRAATSPQHPFLGTSQVYAATSGETFIAALVRRSDAPALRARRAAEVEVYRPLAPEPVARLRVARGGEVSLPGAGAFVLKGTWLARRPA